MTQGKKLIKSKSVTDRQTDGQSGVNSRVHATKNQRAWWQTDLFMDGPMDGWMDGLTEWQRSRMLDKIQKHECMTPFSRSWLQKDSQFTEPSIFPFGCQQHFSRVHYAWQSAKNGQKWPLLLVYIFPLQKCFQRSRRATFNSVGNHL